MSHNQLQKPLFWKLKGASNIIWKQAVSLDALLRYRVWGGGKYGFCCRSNIFFFSRLSQKLASFKVRLVIYGNWLYSLEFLRERRKQLFSILNIYIWIKNYWTATELAIIPFHMWSFFETTALHVQISPTFCHTQPSPGTPGFGDILCIDYFRSRLGLTSWILWGYVQCTELRGRRRESLDDCGTPKAFIWFGGILLWLWLCLLLLAGQEVNLSCEIKPVSIFTHTHKNALSSSPRARVICIAQFLFPFLDPAMQNYSVMFPLCSMPLKWIRCCLRHGSQRDIAVRTWCRWVVQHPPNHSWADCWKGTESPKSICCRCWEHLLHKAQHRAGAALNSVPLEEGEISAVGSHEPSMKGWSRGTHSQWLSCRSKQKLP